MKGAREYAELFETGQYGRFYITSGSHAWGKTFHIQLLPEGEKAITSYGNMCLNPNAVIIYGKISGNPGWAESYGWLYHGKWQADFQKLVADRRKEIEKANEQREKQRIKKLLKDYNKNYDDKDMENNDSGDNGNNGNHGGNNKNKWN